MTDIILSPETQAAQHKEKVALFNDGLKKLEEETGMTVVPFLKPYTDRLQAVLAIVPKNKTIETK
jgi:hypothetical protein